MQKLSFTEIRNRYKEKYEKVLYRNNETLQEKLERYDICQDEEECYVCVKNSQQECEKIVDLLYMEKCAYGEKEIKRKYSLLLQTLPVTYQKAFPETIEYHKGYIQYFINHRKNKSKQMVQSFHALKIMLSLLNKEITEYSDEELAVLIKDKKFTTTARQHTVWFLKYIYNEEPEQFQFSIEMSMLRKETLRGEQDFYTPEEWAYFINVFFDVDRHLERAYNSYTYVRYWLYGLLHISLAWRKSDVLNIPALENLIDISGYTLDWFGDNTFSIANAQRIINHTKLSAEQYLTKKTGAKKHFNIPQTALIPTAIALIICEQWRRKQTGGMQDMLFGKFNVDTGRFTELFGLETDFYSMKANRTLLSMFNEKTSEMNGFSGKAGFLTSYMRSHKTSKKGNADITTVYLRSTYDERESVSMGKQSIDRGFFGWVYDTLLTVSGNSDDTFRENTKLITMIKENLPAVRAEQISGALYSIVKEREMLLQEIYSWDSSEVREKAELLFFGKLISRTEDIACLMSGRCPYPTEDKCMLCRYSIPTIFSLTMTEDELKRLLAELEETSREDEIDRINLTYQIGKLVMILKEAKDRFGYEYVETYINYEEINELIKKETPNMIFLEELQNDTT